VNVTHGHARVRNVAPARALPHHTKQQLRDAHRASRRYRGDRIKAIQLGSTWHAGVHGHTGSIESTSLADAMAQAEWFIEARLAFRPPSRNERLAG